MRHMRRVCDILAEIVVLVLVAFVAPCHAGTPVRIWEDVDGRDGKVKLVPFIPEENPMGVGVIVCPGGSYFWHDYKTEGEGVAQWLCDSGIAAFVLTYRTATIGGYITHARGLFGGVSHPAMIQDLQRALQVVRGNAAGWGIDSCRVGAMGFSAGGHLVMLGAELYGTDFTAMRGVGSGCSLRPDFVAPIYPVVTFTDRELTHKRSRRAALGEWGSRKVSMRDSLSLERHVRPDGPPVFLVNCIDDPVVKYGNSVLLHKALERAGVPHVYHQYKTGGHGFGAADSKCSDECRAWKNEFLIWLKSLYGNGQ